MDKKKILELKEKAAALAAGDSSAALELDAHELEFGEKLAENIGADLSSEHSDEPKNPKVAEIEEAMAAAAKPQDYRQKLATMSFDEQVAATLECLGRKNNQKEILYDLLVFCQQERTEAETEEFLESHKQFADGYHTASKYIFFMQRTGAIEEIEYSESGERITEEMRDSMREQGLSEEEIAESAVAWSYATTEVGNAAINAFDPVKRTKAMLAEQKQSRHASFKRLLQFCETPRSLDEIISFMQGDPGLEIDEHTGVMGMQPSAYIGKLDQAGALTWENGWKTTGGGMEVLETLELVD